MVQEPALRAFQVQEESFLAGRRRNVQEQTLRLSKELEAEAYRDIDARLRARTIDLETGLMAEEDLKKYFTALEKALMRFHTGKMQAINATLRELWQQIYRNSGTNPHNPCHLDKLKA